MPLFTSSFLPVFSLNHELSPSINSFLQYKSKHDSKKSNFSQKVMVNSTS